MRKFVIVIEYNGKDFYGWQKQNDFRTVQGEIEKAIFSVTKQNVEVFGSGRTDAGVHALGQVAHFEINVPFSKEKMKDILNNALPEDINIKSIDERYDDFHARFSAHNKTYVYKICDSKIKNVFSKDFVSREENKLNLKKMRELAKMLVGRHDFKGFCSSNTQVADFVREIYYIKITKKKDIVFFEINGNGFLYNMVRILVGTMIDYSNGKLTMEDVKLALEQGDRSKSGKTMPAGGLYLKEVKY